MTWEEFEILLKKKYLFESYYYGKAKEFYEIGMGSMTDEEYTNIFLKLLRYVPYIKDEKEKIQSFINEFPLLFKYHIEFYEPQSLEEAIRKLKHCYE